MTAKPSQMLRTLGYLRLAGAIEKHEVFMTAQKALSLLDPASTTRAEDAFSELELDGSKFVRSLVKAVTPVTGPNICLLLNRHNHVTLSVGGPMRANRAHRDSHGWTQSYATVLVPLTDAGPGGWTSVLPGSHLLATDTPRDGGGSWLDESFDPVFADQLVAVPAMPGDVVVLDPLLFHRAGTGAPSRPRVMLSLALRAPDELSLAPGPHEHSLAGAHEYSGQLAWRDRQRMGPDRAC